MTGIAKGMEKNSIAIHVKLGLVVGSKTQSTQF